MRVRHVLKFGLVISAVIACGSSDDGELAEYRATKRGLQPIKSKLEALRAALPPVGAETETPCIGAIPSDGLEAIDVTTLAWNLGIGETESYERRLLTSDVLMNARYDLDVAAEPGTDVQTNLINLRIHADGYAKIKHVVVFRPSEVDKGVLSTTLKNGSYVIERPARWVGWAFVFSFEDAPRLLASFRVSEHSPDSLTVQSSDALIERTTQTLRRALLARLSKPDC